jgi:hypothetical protein
VETAAVETATTANTAAAETTAAKAVAAMAVAAEAGAAEAGVAEAGAGCGRTAAAESIPAPMGDECLAISQAVMRALSERLARKYFIHCAFLELFYHGPTSSGCARTLDHVVASGISKLQAVMMTSTIDDSQWLISRLR